MWDNSKSLLLTTWWMRIAMVVWCILGIAVPTLFFMQQIPFDILILFCLLFAPILLAFYGLHKMLSNIQQGLIFSVQNTASLRLVSCSLNRQGFWKKLLIFASGVIGFLGLFVRVIKNMLSEAIAIKEENDFTI